MQTMSVTDDKPNEHTASPFMIQASHFISRENDMF